MLFAIAIVFSSATLGAAMCYVATHYDELTERHELLGKGTPHATRQPRPESYRVKPRAPKLRRRPSAYAVPSINVVLIGDESYVDWL